MTSTPDSELSVDKTLLKELEWMECTGRHCPHETANDHYIVDIAFLKSLIISEGRKMAEWALGSDDTAFSMGLQGVTESERKPNVVPKPVRYRNDLRNEQLTRLNDYISKLEGKM